MTLRLALQELADTHGLDGPTRRRLNALGGLDTEPPALRQWLPRGLAVLAAALLGLGIVMWIAANWESLGRMGRFALLMGFVGVMGLAAALRPALRAPLGLLVLLGIGALFAYFGQTYQTGADPWTLFALWAALAVPLCLGARSDVLWAPWSLVVVTAIALWTHTQLGHRWTVRPEDLRVHALAWSAALALVVALSQPLRHVTGAGLWGLRTAATMAVLMTTLAALGGLFHSTVAPHYVLGLLVLGGAAALVSLRQAFDIFVLSALALALNTLLICGLARLLFQGARGDTVGSLFMIGTVAAGLLAGSVSLILKLSRRHAAASHAAEVAHG
jgi:uncharacterized membrane protein